MVLRQHVKHLRKEHKELLHVADAIEDVLDQASKNDFAERSSCLPKLRSLKRGLVEIVKHCHTEDRLIETAYHEYLRPDEWARSNSEHEQIIRNVTNFREELKFVTADRTMAMILPGLDVVNLLRAHIAFEEKLLNRLSESESAPKTAPGKKKAARKTHPKQKKHAAGRKTRPPTSGFQPYTLELHPEL